MSKTEILDVLRRRAEHLSERIMRAFVRKRMTYDLRERIALERAIQIIERTSSVLVAERCDWETMREEVNALVVRLQQKPDNLKLPYQAVPTGILNAYREGDVTFDEAKNGLLLWRER